MAFPPQKNPKGHKSAQRESRPHPNVMGMSVGQVSNLEGSVHSRPPGTLQSKATPERKKGFKFPSSFSGDAQPGGPRREGKPFGGFSRVGR